MNAAQLSPTEFGPFYQHYVNLVPPKITLRSALDESATLLVEYLTELAEGRENYAYAPGKWTIKQTLQHLIDTERIFAYRALRLGRRDATPLPGFEQDGYVEVWDATLRPFGKQIDEFRQLRESTLSLYESFSEQDLAFLGQASGHPMSARAMGFIISGHTYHHEQLYRERYA